MIKKISTGLIFLLIVIVLVSCGSKNKYVEDQEGEQVQTDTTTFETMKDAFDTDDEGTYRYTKDEFLFVFYANDAFYQATASLTEDDYSRLSSLEKSAGEYSDEFMEAASSLKILSCENLSEKAPSQEELKKYIGKTGQSLVDDGWVPIEFDNENSMAILQKDIYQISIYTKERMYIGGENYEEPEECSNESLSPKTVKEISFVGFGSPLEE